MVGAGRLAGLVGELLSSEAALRAFVCGGGREGLTQGRRGAEGKWRDASGVIKIDLCLWAGHKNSKYHFPMQGKSRQDKADVREVHAFTAKILRKNHED